MNISPQINRHTIEVEPKIYGMLLEFPETNFLSIQIAYSLEEAFIKAKIEMEELEKNMLNIEQIVIKNRHAKISLFSCKTFEELEKGLHKQNQVPIIEIEDIKETVDIIKKDKSKKIINKNTKNNKNKLIKLIIETKDKKLLDKEKYQFTKAEIKYIQERIK